MKFAIFIVSILTGMSISAQVLNSSFEEWSELESFEHPSTEGFEFTSVNNGVFYETGVLGLTQIDGLDSIALRVETNLIGQDTVVGFGLFGNGSSSLGLLFQDGFQVEDPTLDTLRMISRYNISEEYPGEIFMQFYNQNELVTIGENQDSLFLYSFFGEQTVWDTLEIDLVGLELNGDVDQCVLGFSCNSITLAKGSPGDYLEIDKLEFLSDINTVPGGDFNLWSLTEAPIEIDDWTSYFGPTSGFILQSEDATDGDFSIGMRSIQFDSTVVQSSIFLADLTDFGVSPSEELQENAFGLKFNYKFSSSAEDSARVQILLSEDNDPSTFDIITVTEVLPLSEDWSEFTIDFFNVYSEANFYGIQFYSGPQFPGEPADSSLLLIDEVELLFLEDCGLDTDVVPLNANYCPGEEIVFEAESSESNVWYIQNPFDGDFEAVSTEETYSNSFQEFGIYHYLLLAGEGNCFEFSDTLSFEILELESPYISYAGLVNEILCPNSNIELNVENADQFSSFSWYLNEEILEGEDGSMYSFENDQGFSGTYSISAVSADCPNIENSGNTVQIGTYDVEFPEINELDGQLSTQEFSSFQWLLEGEELIGFISQSINPQENGNYSVIVEDENGCQLESEEVLFINSSVDDTEIVNSGYSVYPNPASGLVHLESFSGFLEQIILFNSFGQEVIRFNDILNQRLDFDVSFLDSGIYVLQVGEFETRRFLVYH